MIYSRLSRNADIVYSLSRRVGVYFPAVSICPLLSCHIKGFIIRHLYSIRGSYHSYICAAGWQSHLTHVPQSGRGSRWPATNRCSPCVVTKKTSKLPRFLGHQIGCCATLWLDSAVSCGHTSLQQRLTPVLNIVMPSVQSGKRGTIFLQNIPQSDRSSSDGAIKVVLRLIFLECMDIENTKCLSTVLLIFHIILPRSFSLVPHTLFSL